MTSPTEVEPSSSSSSDDESYRGSTSSGSYSPPPPSIFRCRWNWCRETFHSNFALNNHVVHEHVRKAVPISRTDVSLYRRAEDGGGESFSLGFSGAEGSTSGQYPLLFKYVCDTSKWLGMHSAHQQGGDDPTSQVEHELSPRPHKRARTDPIDSPNLIYLDSQELLPEGSQRLQQMESRQAIPPSPPSTPPAPQYSPPVPVPASQHAIDDARNSLPSPEGGEEEYENTYPSSQAQAQPQASSPAGPQTPPSSTPARRQPFSQITSGDTTPAANLSNSRLASPSLDTQVADALHGGGPTKSKGVGFGERLRRVMGWDKARAAENSIDESDQDAETGNEATPRISRTSGSKDCHNQELVGSQGSVESRRGVEMELTQELDDVRDADEADAASESGHMGSRSRHIVSNSPHQSGITSLPPSNPAITHPQDADMDAEPELQWPEPEGTADADAGTSTLAPSPPPRRYGLRSRSRSVVQPEARPKPHSRAASQAVSLIDPIDARTEVLTSQQSAPLALRTQVGEPSYFSNLENTQSQLRDSERAVTPKRTLRSRTPATHSHSNEVGLDKTPSQKQRGLRPRTSFRSGNLSVVITPQKVPLPPPATPKAGRRAATTPDRNHRPAQTRSHSRSVEPDRQVSNANTRKAYNAGTLISQPIAEASSQEMENQAQAQTQDSYYSQPLYLQLQTQAPYESQSLESEYED